MNALQAIESSFEKLGYLSQVRRRDYKFADVWAADAAVRTVNLAVFTQLPESYRSAAFGVIEGRDEEALEAIAARRALGAPLFLSIAGERVSVWQVGASGAPQRLQTVELDALDELFAHNRERWNPQALHRAKALPPTTPRQLDFVDLGLLPAIEREIQAKLHRVLGDVLGLLLGKAPSRDQEVSAFQTTFRLLAAKILKDREHPAAADWMRGDVRAVLEGIASHYQLVGSQTAGIFLDRHKLDLAWDRFSHSVSLQNISADTLAFVYENTLVTADSRKRFGTHSTPRQLADYVMNRLDLSRFDLDSLRIHEPFAGAGVFLVSALRHLQDLLPTKWTPEERHNYLIPKISGSELDAFACEVATLSLILADYPNANGWKNKIHCQDLFEEGALAQTVGGSTVVLCNPPFENFNPDERSKYKKTTNISFSKAQFAFKTALEAKPEAFGFIMPHGFLRQSQFKELRAKLSNQYKSIELVSLPEGIFEKARFETALVVATELRMDKSTEAARIRSGRIARKNYAAFLENGEPSLSSATRPAGSDELWVGPLDDLWALLADKPKLGQSALIYRGLKWWKQKEGISDMPREGFRPGIYRPRESLRAFKLLPAIRHLSFRPEDLMYPGPPSRPWEKPKVLMNTKRISQGRWRIKAAPDTLGLAASQQIFGIWLINNQISIDALAAILNNPLANAYVFERSNDQDFTNEMLKELPMPSNLDEPELLRAVASYRAGLDAIDAGQLIDATELEARLRRIDELVLDGYGLPMYLRRRLFDYFSEETRPVPHRFSSWDTPAPTKQDLLKAARERALARGRRLQISDLEKAGGGLNVQTVAQLLEATPAQVQHLVEQQSLLALPTESGLVFPAIQFEGNAPVPGLREFLAAFPGRSPWVRLNYLVHPDLRLGGKRPIDSLRRGEIDQVIAAVRLVGEHIAA